MNCHAEIKMYQRYMRRVPVVLSDRRRVLTSRPIRYDNAEGGASTSKVIKGPKITRRAGGSFANGYRFRTNTCQLPSGLSKVEMEMPANSCCVASASGIGKDGLPGDQSSRLSLCSSK